jgi:ketosteroid isomerase-like protein
MSQENVEIVRRMLGAYVAGDLEKGLADADREIVWNPVEETPRQGHDAVRENLRRWETEWEDLRTVPEEFLDAGERVVVTVHLAGRGRGSGIDVDARHYQVWTIHDGKAVRMDEFTDRSDALEAVGLREEDLKPAE